MKDWEQLDAQRHRAARKVKQQDEIVRNMDGSAHEHPEAQNLLSEMRHNQAAIDFNRVLFEYEEDGRNQRAAS